MTDQKMALSCSCGQVVLKVQGSPIVSAECLCNDCQKAGVFKLFGSWAAMRFRTPKIDFVRGDFNTS